MIAPAETMTNSGSQAWGIYVGQIRLFIHGPGFHSWCPASEANFKPGGAIGTKLEMQTARRAVEMLRRSHRYESADEETIKLVLAEAKRQVLASNRRDDTEINCHKSRCNCNPQQREACLRSLLESEAAEAASVPVERVPPPPPTRRTYQAVYSPEFKRESVNKARDLMKAENLNVTDCARRLNLAPQRLHHWMRGECLGGKGGPRGPRAAKIKH